MPAQITYGPKGIYRVSFRYATRGDGYNYATGGGLILVGQRLTAVAVDSVGGVLRAYALRYHSESGMTDTLLASVQEFGTDASVATDGTVTGTALPAHTFEPQPATQVPSPWTKDEGPNNSIGFTVGTPVDHGGPSGWDAELSLETGKSGWLTADVDGDRRADWVSAHWRNTPDGNRTDLRVLRPKRDGGYAEPVITETSWPFAADPTHFPLPWRLLPADVNADGRTDLFRVSYGSAGTVWLETAVASGGGRFEVLPGIDLRIPWNENNQYMIGDVNGDSRADLVAAIPHGELSQIAVVMTTIPGQVSIHTTSLSLAWGGDIDPANGHQLVAPLWRVADVNGDGKADVLRVEARAPDAAVGIPHLAVRTLLSYGEGAFEIAHEADLPVPWTLPGARAAEDRAHVGDFNGDGRDDLAFLNVYTDASGGRTVMVQTLFAQGNGGYDRPVPFDTQMGPLLLAAGREPFLDLNGKPALSDAFPGWQTGDFDGDGATDLLVTTPPPGGLAFANWPSTVTLIRLISNRRGDFAPQPAAPTNWRVENHIRCSTDINGQLVCRRENQLAFDVSAADVNGDGRDDIAYAGLTGNKTGFVTGLHTVVSPNSMADTSRWLPADIDGDLLPDLINIVYTNPGLTVYTSLDTNNLGRVNVAAEVLPTFQEQDTRAWRVADVGSPSGGLPDGRADLVLVTPAGGVLPSTGTRVTTLFSNGDGTWTPVDRTYESWPLLDMANWQPIDVDGDGRTDLVDTWMDQGQFTAVTLFSAGDGSWTRAATPHFAGLPDGASTWLPADVDGDGDSDLVGLHHPGPGATAVLRTLRAEGRADWTEESSPLSGDGIGSDTTGWQVGELNGDGKADLLRVRVPDVLNRKFLSGPVQVVNLLSAGDGKTWERHVDWPQYDFTGDAEVARLEANTARWIVLDVDGDNLTDLAQVDAYKPMATQDYRVSVHTLVRRGRGWRADRQTDLLVDRPDTSGWVASDWSTESRDGLILISLSGSSPVVNFLRSIRRIPRIEQTGNGLGTTEYVTYGNATAGNPGERHQLPLGSRRTVVREVSTRVQPQNVSARTEYYYAGGRWDYASALSLGFGQVVARDGTGTSLTVDYAQSQGCVDMPLATTVRADAAVVHRTRYEYQQVAGPPYSCLLSRQDVDEFEYTSIARTASSRYFYDEFGNEVRKEDFGEFRDSDGDGADDLPADNRIDSHLYLPNYSAYTVGLPSDAKISDYTGALVQWERFGYDHQAIGAAPTKGELTLSQRWDDVKNAWVPVGYDYDSDGNRTIEVDQMQRTTTTHYDKTYNYFPEKTCNLLICTSQTWDLLLGKVHTTTDANQNVTTHHFDRHGRPLRVDYPGGGCVAYGYVDFGDPSKQRVLEQKCLTPNQDLLTQQNTLWLVRYFDGQDRTWQIDRVGGSRKNIAFRGTTEMVASETDWFVPSATGVPSARQFGYDAAGRMIRMTHPDGATRETRYGPGTRLTVDELGHARLDHLDVRGFLSTVEERVTVGTTLTAFRTSYRYDALDRATDIVDDAGNATTTRWTSLGTQRQSCDPDRGCHSFAYYDDGSLRTQTDAKGQLIEYGYDQAGRLENKTYATTGRSARWFYDTDPISGKPLGASAGHITRVEDPGGIGSATFTYDVRGNVSRTDRCLGPTCVSWATAYDVAGRPELVTYPDASGTLTAASERVRYGYDTTGRLAKVAQDGPGGQLYVEFNGYAADDQPLDITYGNGTTAIIAYDQQRRWPDSYQVIGPGGGVLVDETLGHDAAGRISTLTSAGPAPAALTMGHDELDRLTSVSGSWKQTFHYDPLGNMTFNSQLGTLAYKDPKHAHASSTVAGSPYAYDDNGNLTSGGGRAISWTDEDQPNAVTTAAGTTRFTYDATGSRTSKTEASGAQTVYAGPYVEIKPGGSHVLSYFAGDRLIAKRDVGGLTWYHHDHLGSPQVLTDGQGAEVARFGFAPYGANNGTVGAQSIGYAGHRSDPETGLIDMGSRLYDAALGRFISADSVIPDGTKPQALNRYAYAFDSPYDFVDPDGHAPKTCGQFETCVHGSRESYRQITTFVWEQWGVRRRGEREHEFRTGTQEVLMQRGRHVVRYPNGPGSGKEFQYVGPCPSCHGVGPRSGEWSRELTSQEERELYATAKAGVLVIGGAGMIGLGGMVAGAAGAAGGAGAGGASVSIAATAEGELVLAGAAEGALVLDKVVTVGGVVAVAAMNGSGPNDVNGVPEGSFSIWDWSGYPAGVPKPDGPFRLLPKGAEYDAARDAADAANKALHGKNPSFSENGMQIHENQPVKFGGDPVNAANKTVLPANIHRALNTWWRSLQRYLQGG
ncbi:FG-GAP-like repeat-containing protein [Amycolatopsis sp. NPDC049688]|uniref:RHS repeat-associated core domain-containing protein n=1 Tax=Amycolatopsis sp. NPDC049688 TaxID=3154733 RepID=UPI00342A5246